MNENNKQIYTVSQLNTLIQTVMLNNLPSRVNISGEITNWRAHSSGHRYFILKDKGSQIPCVMWKSSLDKTKFNPDNGMEVIANGHIDLYVPHGKYQMYVDSIRPQGTGSLQLAFEQMVKKLQTEGLFEDKHKKPIPPYPMRIGLVTSESGAAIQDISDSIWHRWPPTRLILFPVSVQGAEAAGQIVAGIKYLNKNNHILKLDTIITGRGGGSMEDLWAFNEEIVARAIFESKIPIISAVGHEIDTTIADLVADARASTPTKAGIIAVPDISDVTERLIAKENRLNRTLSARLENSNLRLQRIQASAVFKNPDYAIQRDSQKLDIINDELDSSIHKKITKTSELLNSFTTKIQKAKPENIILRNFMRVERLENSLKNQINLIINKQNINLSSHESTLKGLNPRSVLSRGYSITRDSDTGHIISPENIPTQGNSIITEIKGKIFLESEVKKTNNTQP